MLAYINKNRQIKGEIMFSLMVVEDGIMRYYVICLQRGDVRVWIKSQGRDVLGSNFYHFD